VATLCYFIAEEEKQNKTRVHGTELINCRLEKFLPEPSHWKAAA